jgi:phenylpyruvate tautomerase PptA (4-oxalocrotonate tautomerase family)
MPTYIVTVQRDQLDASQKTRIAQGITRVHSETTGVPSYLAQVIFSEVDKGNYFVGGRPLSHGHVFVHGQIRGGRTPDSKSTLISSMLKAVAEAASVPCTGSGSTSSTFRRVKWSNSAMCCPNRATNRPGRRHCRNPTAR